ncbi:MAG TPA: MFS transporter [Pirellulales bacterium]|nr:MFS transporter [Pirellulales bacterium]
MATPIVPQINAVRLARWTVGLLLTINLLNYVDRFVLAAAVPEIKAEFLSPDDPESRSKMGTLNAAFLWSYMLTAPIFGRLGERMSRWKLIGLAAIGWSLASGASGLAQTFTMLWLTRLFVGLGEAAYGPVAPTVLADLFPPERRGQVLSWFYMAIPVGSAIGYALGGTIADHWHWRWAFYIVVVPGMLLGVASFFMPDPRRGGAEVQPVVEHRARLADYGMLLRTPSYVFNTLGMTALTFAIGGVAYWMPDYVSVFRGEGELGRVNLIFGSITVVTGITATLLGGLAGDWLTKRFAGGYFLVSGAALLLAFPCFQLVLHTPFRPFPWAWIWIFMTEFFLFFNTGPTNTIIANVTHPSVRSTAYAVNIFMIHLLGDAISPALIGALADRFGGDMNIGFSAVSCAIVVGAVFWFLGSRYLKRDMELMPTRVRSAKPVGDAQR